jgi:hypothetical protein
MRRVYVVIGIWFVIAAGVTAAFGDPVMVKVKGEPTAVVAGQPYVVSLLVTKYGRGGTRRQARRDRELSRWARVVPRDRARA